MMVMFAFEFAVLAVTSLSTIARYNISLYEASVIKEQTRLQVQERRAEIQRQRQRHQQRQDEQGEANQAESLDINSQTTGSLPIGDDSEVADEDVDVPGWESKGRWVFYLDLTTGMYVC